MYFLNFLRHVSFFSALGRKFQIFGLRCLRLLVPYLEVLVTFEPGLVACACNSATLEAEFPNAVGSIPVGKNSPSKGGCIVYHLQSNIRRGA